MPGGFASDHGRGLVRALVPLLIAVALLAAWGCRWEKGPTKSDTSAILVFYRDQWANQEWAKVYGFSTYPLVVSAPVFSSQSISSGEGERCSTAEGVKIGLTAVWGVAFVVSICTGLNRGRKLLRAPTEHAP